MKGTLKCVTLRPFTQLTLFINYYLIKEIDGAEEKVPETA